MPVSRAAGTLALSPGITRWRLIRGPVVRKQVPSKKATVKAAPKKKAAAASTKAPKAAAAAERPPVPKTRRPKLRMDGSSWLGASPASAMAPSPVLKVLAATRSPSPPRRKSLTRRNSTPRRRSPPAAADGDDEGDGGTPLVIDGSRPSLSPLGSSTQSAASTGRQLEVHVPAPVRATASASVTPPPPAPTEALLREQVSTLTAARREPTARRDGEMPFREVGEVERLAAQLLPFTDAADAATPQLSAAPRALGVGRRRLERRPAAALRIARRIRSALDLGRERAAERDAARDAYDAEREAAAENGAELERRPRRPPRPPLETPPLSGGGRRRRRHRQPSSLPRSASSGDIERRCQPPPRPTSRACDLPPRACEPACGPNAARRGERRDRRARMAGAVAASSPLGCAAR